MRKQIRVVQPEFMSAQQNFAKIHQPLLLAVVLIYLIEIPQLATERVGGRNHMGGTATLVFLPIDEPLKLLWRKAAVINVVLFHQTLDQA